MQGIKRRVVYVGLYELVAIVLTSVLLIMMGGGSASDSLYLATAISLLAIVWNLVFNNLFERWEARRGKSGRSLALRIGHAFGFEGGLLLSLVPLVAWWYGVSLWQALLMDIGLLVFFLIYTFVFNWLFDRLFGLPTSAQPTQVLYAQKSHAI